MTEDRAPKSCRVVGYEGIVGEAQTPARCAPVLVDSADNFVRFEASGGQPELVRLGGRWDGHVIPGRATPLEPPGMARPDWLFVVIGQRERKYTSLLSDTPSEVTLRALRALDDEHIDGQVWPVGSLRALYLSRDDVLELGGELRYAAESAVLEACERGDPVDIADAGWWMKNAAVNEDEVFFALGALARGKSRYVRDLAAAFFPERDVNTVMKQVRSIESDLPNRRGQRERSPWNGLRKRLELRRDRRAAAAAAA